MGAGHCATVETLEGPAVGTAAERIAAWRAVRERGGPPGLCGTRVEADRRPLATLGPQDILGLPGGLARGRGGRRARGGARAVTPHALHPLYVRRPDVEQRRDGARAASPR
jgi:hypothetical protein